MRVEIYWIDLPETNGRLAVLPRPRGGDWLEDELRELRGAGVDLLVCLLTDAELAELDLEALPFHAATVGIDLVRLPIEDRSVPDALPFAAIVERLADATVKSRGVAVHCRMGVGRSGLLAAAVLYRLGLELEEAWQRVQKARGRPVPDVPEQRCWLSHIANRIR